MSDKTLHKLLSHISSMQDCVQQFFIFKPVESFCRLDEHKPRTHPHWPSFNTLAMLNIEPPEPKNSGSNADDSINLAHLLGMLHIVDLIC
jgi:hypothetical protein